ncbi:hypothetical protein BU15DRAFT_73705 [Melanogaster broomeanus]|nr:hypothetical protein BU15DRAFT_73705 [Melanogaster broomeanus]
MSAASVASARFGARSSSSTTSSQRLLDRGTPAASVSSARSGARSSSPTTPSQPLMDRVTPAASVASAKSGARSSSSTTPSQPLVDRVTPAASVASAKSGARSSSSTTSSQRLLDRVTPAASVASAKSRARSSSPTTPSQPLVDRATPAASVASARSGARSSSSTTSSRPLVDRVTPSAAVPSAKPRAPSLLSPTPSQRLLDQGKPAASVASVKSRSSFALSATPSQRLLDQGVPSASVASIKSHSSSALSTTSSWRANVTESWFSPPPPNVNVLLSPAPVVWMPVYPLLPSSIQLVPQPSLQCILCGNQPSLFGRQDHPSLPAPNVACPQCQVHPKHPDHRFCSPTRTEITAASGQLIPLFRNDETFINIENQFLQHWKAPSRPMLLGILMITWTKKQEKDIRKYKNEVEARGRFQQKGLFAGNEQKQFQCAVRACTLGENKNVSPCTSESCELCETIRCGFQPYLERKRAIPSTSPCGIRLGAGIYITFTSSKADEFAVNRHDASSRVKAMFVCCVVVGKPYETKRENTALKSPPAGHDCVVAKPGRWSEFTDDECVVYDADAIRAAYLVVYTTVP